LGACMRIVLIRHGQTLWNKEEIFRGRADIPLDEMGIQQARAIANRLSLFSVNAVYSSPLRRALETAQIIAAELKVNITVDDNLTDLDFGKWQGLSVAEVQRLFPELYGRWLKEPHLVKIPGGETLGRMKKRAAIALAKTLIKEKNDAVIVTHRAVIKILICAALSLDNSCFWRIKQDTGTISILDCKEGRFALSLLNDSCHLADISKQGEDHGDF